MSLQLEAESIITELWLRYGMTDNSGTDAVRDELKSLLVKSYEAGRDGKPLDSITGEQ
mgnify:CR=1 FL=1